MFRRWLGMGAFLLGPALVFAQGAPGDSTADSTAAPAAIHPTVAMTITVESEGRATNLGRIVIELYPEDAPRHVENFLGLVDAGFYENLAFHRIVPAFIVQGGDPITRDDWTSSRAGTGGPDRKIPAEIGRRHVRGAVAAARQPDAVNPSQESSGSQFFICLADLPGLDQGGYSVFGQVIQGMDVVDKIARVRNSGTPQNRALQRVTMTDVKRQQP